MLAEKQLLIDYCPFEITPEQINESIQNHNGKLIVSGLLQKANERNFNGRIYPKKILMREADKYLRTQIKERRAIGELDHPESQIINLNNVSHNILDLWWKDNDLYGKLEVLTTPSGNILRELFKNGIKLGISSRGLGSVKELKEDNTVEVCDDFEIICFDMVSSPSTRGAFMYPLTEGINKKNSVNNKWINVERLITEILMGA